jgi:hypothetical protein
MSSTWAQFVAGLDAIQQRLVEPPPVVPQPEPAPPIKRRRGKPRRKRREPAATLTIGDWLLANQPEVTRAFGPWRPPPPESARAAAELEAHWQQRGQPLPPKRSLIETRRRGVRECECGNASFKPTGEDLRCERCIDLEANYKDAVNWREGYGTPRGGMRDRAQAATGKPDARKYRGHVPVWPELRAETLSDNPRLQRWLRAKARLPDL